MSRVVRFHELGGPQVLRLEQQEPATPRAGDVLVRIATIGLNRAEANYRAGLYFEQPRTFPAGLGYEAAGHIELAGEDVTGFAVGDAVSILPTFSMNDYTVYGDHAVVPASALARLPDTLDMAGGAAVWMPYLTAYGALVDIAHAGPGDVVAITAASSSVGLAAIQIANQVGATPVAVTRTADKAAALRDAGAATVVTADEDLAERIGGSARIVFDAIAGPAVTTLAAATTPGGIVILYGSLSRQQTPFPRAAVAKGLNFRGYLVFEILRDPTRRAAAEKYILDGLAAGELNPKIDRTFELSEVVAAHQYLESNQQVGKILMKAD
jgi:NADPH:quinone reductase-like Zn-dependent oxidoreductase